MKRLNVLVLLFVVFFTVAGPTADAVTPEKLIWWEFETVKENPADESAGGGMAAFLKRQKRLILHEGSFPLSETGDSVSGGSLATGETNVWIRTPDGVVKRADIAGDTDAVVLNLPSDLDPGDVSGRYLVAAHMDAGVMDTDSDGKDEKVHLYSKYLVNYSKQGGVAGSRPDTFFREGDTLALEIGPVLTKSIFKSAGCPHANVIKGKETVTSYISDGGTQTPLQEYRMNVLYQGEPLANSEVIVLSRSGWKKTVTTDAEGALSFTPPNILERSSESGGTGRSHGMSRSGRMQATEDKLLYMVAYKDPSTGEYHCSTLPVALKTATSTDTDASGKAGGFALWGITGAGLCCVGFGGGIYHRKRRNRDTMFRSEK